MKSHHWELWTSSCSLFVNTDDEASFQVAQKVVGETCQEVEQAINRFDPASEISLILSSGILQTQVSQTLANILSEALAAYTFSDGAFDPRVGERLENAGYGIKTFELNLEKGILEPVETPLEKLTDLVKLEGNQLTLARPVYLDLTSLGKAYAARIATQKAAAASGASVLVNLGGDIATAGPLTPWTIEVQDLEQDPVSTIDLINNGAIATSSTQKRRWVKDGGLWHHIIDPRTGVSAEPILKTASVITNDPVLSNALSTSAIVWGRDAAARLSQHPFPFRLVTADNQVITQNWPAEG